jgi:hypothetical protein
MEILSRFQRFYRWSKEIIRYNGLMIFLWRLLQRVFRPWGRMELVTFLQKDLRQPLKEVKQPVNLTITIANESDIEPLIELERKRLKTRPVSEINERIDWFRRRFKKGSLCFIAKNGQEPIHYNWISFHSDQALGGYYLHVKENEANCLDAFTLENWRGKGIHPAGHYLMLYYLQQHGYLKAYTLIDADNRSSIKGLQPHGWSNLGIVFCFTPRDASKGWIVPLNRSLANFVKTRLLAHE